MSTAARAGDGGPRTASHLDKESALPTSQMTGDGAPRLASKPRRAWLPRLASAFLVLLGCVAYAFAKPDIAVLVQGPIEITAHAIGDFRPSEPGRTRFGKLEWRGGLVLTSTSPFFGGYSGLVVEADGSRLLAVSDSGSWLTAGLDSQDGKPLRLTQALIGPITALKGKPLRRDADRDSEGLSLDSGSLEDGVALISFEQNRRIGRFPVAKGVPDAPQSYVQLPAEALALRGNKSLESVAVIAAGPAKGSIATFAEHKPDEDGIMIGWLIGPKSTETLRLEGRGDFDISDMAALPDGGVLVLERRFRWSEGIHIRIRRLSAEEITSGKPMTGEVLLEAGPGETIDNMEGIAVHADASGALIVTLISDDNFSLLQHTVLLQFAIAEGAT